MISKIFANPPKHTKDRKTVLFEKYLLKVAIKVETVIKSKNKTSIKQKKFRLMEIIKQLKDIKRNIK